MLTGSVSRRKWGVLYERYPYLGMLLCPSGWRTPWCRRYAADNDCFAHRNDPGWWEREGEARWLAMLDKLAGTRPMFVLLPDVVGDWNATLDRSARYRGELADRNLPAAVALQDGCDFREALALSPDTVFVGGTTDWKLRSVEPACAIFRPRGIRVHVGRVNSRDRLFLCRSCGADSVDGTGWNRYSDAMLPVMDRAMAQRLIEWEGVGQ